ncbi:MAG: hypothetical protein JWN76_2468 [Chitinophagaceae bacterium]|nr:hypothetical protein [Chitinophagaceae bacterium]
MFCQSYYSLLGLGKKCKVNLVNNFFMLFLTLITKKIDALGEILLAFYSLSWLELNNGFSNFILRSAPANLLTLNSNICKLIS